MSEHNFSDQTRRLLTAAREEAARLRQEQVGTEHLLLAALRLPELAPAFVQVGASPEDAIARLEAGLKQGTSEAAAADLGYRSGAKKILDHAAVSARDQESPAVEPEHVVAALLRERRGPGFQALQEAGAKFEPRGEKAPRPDEARPERGRRDQPRPEDATPAIQAVKPEAPPSPAAKAPTQSLPRERPPRPERGQGGRQKHDRQPPPKRGREERPAPVPEVPAAPVVEEPARARPPKPVILSHRDPILTWRNLLLLAVPGSIALRFLQAEPALVFVVAGLAVVPLAGYMGEATEHLAYRSGPGVGGLLNATFGNAAELIIALFALQAGLVDLVKASITGSILGNLLLILGLSLTAGGMRQATLRFNRTAAGVSAAMLALAVVGLVLPALFHNMHPSQSTQELHLSEGVAIVLAVTYCLSLVFSMRTHREILRPEDHAVGASPWGVGRALMVLAVATAGVAVESEILVHATVAVTATLGLSQLFLGLIVIPIIGNAAEHATAVTVARKGKIDLALGIALGSSTQVALFVAPVLVLAGVLMGQGMNLVFTSFEVAALGLATVVCAIITLDGESHWFEGVQLLAVYALVGLAAFFL